MGGENRQTCSTTDLEFHLPGVCRLRLRLYMPRMEVAVIVEGVLAIVSVLKCQLDRFQLPGF